MTAATDLTIHYDAVSVSEPLSRIQEMIRPCIQCGICTGSCPNVFAMDYTPRQLWRQVLLGQKDEIFRSKTFSLCSDCYTCTLRCPRGLPLTEAMDGLKQIAAKESLAEYRASTLFYKNFIRSVRRHGRVREMEFMTNYFTALRSPLVPLRFASLGIKLLVRGKVSINWFPKARFPLEKIFQKVNELEKHT
ncbi:MAG: 4Fe-4S dicluster domain-containing protein [Deltaproteobacteria bacterium]|jgi:heterodisulfide reductase subunit C|nr:4Fe-4S dicluster domain-containing protein [Deltaproteobacteria bacterium]